jgi:hypothetical protein
MMSRVFMSHQVLHTAAIDKTIADILCLQGAFLDHETRNSHVTYFSMATRRKVDDKLEISKIPAYRSFRESPDKWRSATVSSRKWRAQVTISNLISPTGHGRHSATSTLFLEGRAYLKRKPQARAGGQVITATTNQIYGHMKDEACIQENHPIQTSIRSISGHHLDTTQAYEATQDSWITA